MRTLPLTVLMHNSPIGRAYLGMLAALGCRPQRLLLMVYPHHPGTGKRMGGWLPVSSWRTRYRAWAQDAVINHWSRRIKRQYSRLHESVVEALTTQLDVPETVMDAVTAPLEWGQFAESVEHITVDGLKDPALQAALAQDAPQRCVLYTGGGLVPRELLDIGDLKVLHIHPGWLPEVRGADGILWSTLVRGRPGASCFYMAPGLDTGPIVERMEFEPLGLDARWLDEIDQATLYRAVYAFVDPAIRAALLRRLVTSNQRLESLSTVPQDPDAGVVYHFMHPLLQRQALARLFHVGTPGLR